MINRQTAKILFLVLTAQLWLHCAGTGQQVNAVEKNVDYLIEQGKLHWANRNDSLSLFYAEHFISLAYEKRSEDFNLAILYSQVLYTQALFSASSARIKDSLFQIGADISKKATLTHPDFQSIYQVAQGDSTFRLLSAIADAPQNIVPGLYWWATNQAYYLYTKPVIERLNNRELLEVIMHRINSLNPGYHFGGPYRFFGTLYTRLPGVDISQSKKYFEQALTHHPEYLGNAVQMAEYYHQKKGNREFFHQQLSEVIATDLYNQPEILPENILYQDRARYLLAIEATLFE